MTTDSIEGIESVLASIRPWFQGKSLESLQEHAHLLVSSCREGYWTKGAARRIKAVLNKQSVTLKYGRQLESVLNSITTSQGARSAWAASHAMRFALVYDAPQVAELCRKLLPEAATRAQRDALETAKKWADDHTRLAEILRTLDERRKSPTIVCKTLSPTVVANLRGSLGIDLTTVESAPSKGEWRTYTKKDGTKVQYWFVTILWPEGTKHHRSRFAGGSRAGNPQCEACGHAIRDPWNWVPLLVRDDAGAPLSLWTGKDCARKLFGCEVDGDAHYAEHVGEIGEEAL